jgi:hypothetical protein
MWDANEITTEEAQQKILEILNSHGVDYQAAGELLGGAFQSAWEKAFLQIFPLIDDYNKKMREALDLQAQLARVAPDVVDKMATTIEEASKLGAVFPGGTFHFAPPQLPGFTQPISTFHFQHGGVVPGRFIAHQDTVLSALQPGERVLTREQNIVFGQLAEALRTGKLGQPTFVFHGHVWDKEQLMRDVRDDLARYGTVTPGGIFGGRG